MRTPIRTALAALALFAATPALAAPPTVAELEAEVKADKKALKDAGKDLKAIETIQKKWERARLNDKENKEAKMDAKLDEWLSEELKENKRDRAAAKREYIQMGGNADAVRRDGIKRKIRTPRRAEDDKQDFIKVRAHAENTAELSTELRGMQPAFTHGAAKRGLYDAKSDLINGLVIGAKRDVKRAEKELTEDEAHLARRN